MSSSRYKALHSCLPRSSEYACWSVHKFVFVCVCVFFLFFFIPGTISSLKNRYQPGTINFVLTNRVARGVCFSLDYRVYPFLVGK